MDAFDLRKRLVDDYRRYTRSFIRIRNARISEFVEDILAAEGFWPEPLLQLNPTFRPGGTIDDLVEQDVLHPECARIFRIDKSDSDHSGKQLLLHRHQREAILEARRGRSYVLTTGTGSGKSLAYIVPIVDHVLRRGSGRGIQAIVVYPMNALANSQHEELGKFIDRGGPDGQPPVRFARYTGQEKGEAREEIRRNPPDILLTNYMMLELLLTRIEDRELVRTAQGLRFLVFDELHTYRGRQGADVAMLIRRCRHAFGNDIVCVGTSATMASGGGSEDERLEVAKVSQSLFGVDFTPEQIVTETLERATPAIDTADATIRGAIRAAVASDDGPPTDYEAFRGHPLASWIESTFGVREEAGTGKLLRQVPRRLEGGPSERPESEPTEEQSSAATDLSELTGADPDRCAAVLREWLLAGSKLRKDDSSRFPIFAFRLHQFLTRGDTVWATLEPTAYRHLEIAKQAAKPGEPDKPLYPLVFCRRCGTEYYRVRAIENDEGPRLLPREDRRSDDSDGGEDAYLHLSDESPWPRADGPALLERLPDSLKETSAQGVERIRPNARKDVPEPVFVDSGGRVVPEGEGAPAALIRRNFLFCLEPSCRVAYTRSQRSERFKLATLGVDNRSTATTILAVQALIAVQGYRDLLPEARKLLSFTDNRQDASLQAGHFNDFVQVALLRSALHRACDRSQPFGLRHGGLSRAVFDAMNPRFDDYAADPDVRGPARLNTEHALRRSLEYFLYAHLEAGDTNLAEMCDRCGAALDAPSRIDRLVQMQNVSLRLAQRITCDEEERQRFGYNLVTAYRFPEVNGRLDRRDAEVLCDGVPVARLSYGDATDLWRVNLGWAHQDGTAPRGFNLDIERGYWSRNQADAADRDDATAEGRIVRVVPFVRDTKNALVMRFEPPRSGPEIASLQAAFKQAIQQHFQLEPRELACEPMPSRWSREEVFFHEVSEGGAGVLRQLVDDPAAMPALARRALAICHYDPDTLEDRGAGTCGKACYECLLDYANQPDHRELDRSLIRDTLAGLARAECRPAGGEGSRAERLSALRRRCDSRLEERWLDLVEELGLRLPSEAQYRIPAYATRPDFFYREAHAAIYIDGPPHDTPDQIREDDATTETLIGMGYIVIRFHHEDDWLAIFRRHADVFGTPTPSSAP